VFVFDMVSESLESDMECDLVEDDPGAPIEMEFDLEADPFLTFCRDC
jgi:hypothetical protein